jgi:hypothetical protein
VWARTVPDLDGTYHAALEIDDDTAFPLTDTTAHAHAVAVLSAVARAEYDAAVLHQLGGPPEDQIRAGQMVSVLRDLRAPIAWPSPLTLEPGVSAFNGRPFLTVNIHGRPVGQWTPSDARGNALHVLEAVEAASLDTDYGRVLRDVGVPAEQARTVVADLATHRTTTEATS